MSGSGKNDIELVIASPRSQQQQQQRYAYQPQVNAPTYYINQQRFPIQQQQPYPNQPHVVYITAPPSQVEEENPVLIGCAWFWAISAFFCGGIFCAIPACCLAGNKNYKISLIFSAIGIGTGLVALAIVLAILLS